MLFAWCLLYSMTSAPLATEAAAKQSAALALMRALDAHVRRRMFPRASPHAAPDSGPPPPACLAIGRACHSAHAAQVVLHSL